MIDAMRGRFVRRREQRGETMAALGGLAHGTASWRRHGGILFGLMSAMALGSAASAVTVTVTPAPASVTFGGTQHFNATVIGASNTSVTWSVQEGAGGGSIAADGTYTAGVTAGSFHVVATSVAAPQAFGTATVTVFPLQHLVRKKS